MYVQAVRLNFFEERQLDCTLKTNKMRATVLESAAQRRGQLYLSLWLRCGRIRRQIDSAYLIAFGRGARLMDDQQKYTKELEF